MNFNGSYGRLDPFDRFAADVWLAADWEVDVSFFFHAQVPRIDDKPVDSDLESVPWTRGGSVEFVTSTGAARDVVFWTSAAATSLFIH
jgi:hypothetical protein